MVWISDTNYDTILRTLPLNFSKNFCSFEKLYQKRHAVFHAVSRHRQVGRQTRCSRVFFNDQTSNQLNQDIEQLITFFNLHLFTECYKCEGWGATRPQFDPPAKKVKPAVGYCMYSHLYLTFLLCSVISHPNRLLP